MGTVLASASFFVVDHRDGTGEIFIVANIPDGREFPVAVMRMSAEAIEALGDPAKVADMIIAATATN